MTSQTDQLALHKVIYSTRRQLYSGGGREFNIARLACLFCGTMMERHNKATLIIISYKTGQENVNLFVSTNQVWQRT